MGPLHFERMLSLAPSERNIKTGELLCLLAH